MNLKDLQNAAERLGEHPQDHGWRQFFRLVARDLSDPSSDLSSILERCALRQPAHSPGHLINLFGIALKSVAPEDFALLGAPASEVARAALLGRMAREHADGIATIVEQRRNSFTGARRFLVPQVILSACLPRHSRSGLCFADLGTGLGIMPKQINNEKLFTAFSADLPWPGGVPAYREAPIRRALAVDRGPFPDLHWVRECYGSSEYYDSLFGELVFALDAVDVNGATTETCEVDLLDTAVLRQFLHRWPIHAANLSYVLYEIAPDRRTQIINTLRDNLRPPGLIIVTEPRAELTRQGCETLVYCDYRTDPYRLCTVSDGHFIGEVTALEDYDEFTARYPIAFQPS
ncbi:hypothetical protein [Actinomadura physcomitrii]|uniref:hypothetical protein n=1 Tax=Actinomadura physcomitrii TaxID=2650748 RepID=UPI001368DE72|nr:hypothetical protein [Actinomadura physcomitrii]